MDGLAGRIGRDEFGASVCTKKAAGSLPGNQSTLPQLLRNAPRGEIATEVVMSTGRAVKKVAPINFAELYMTADMDQYLFKHNPKGGCTTALSN